MNAYGTHVDTGTLTWRALTIADAAAVASTSRQVGATLGVAVLGSVVTARIVGPVSTGFVSAAHLGWLIMAATGLGLFVVGLVTTGRWALRTVQVFDEPRTDRSGGLEPLAVRAKW